MNRTAASALFVAIAFAVGFMGGRVTAPEAADKPTPGATVLTPGAKTAAAPGIVPVDQHPPGCGHDHTELNRPSSNANEVAAAGKPVDFTAAFNAARAARSAPSDEHAKHAARAASEDLRERLMKDPRALAAAIEKFRGLRDPASLDMLAAVLGRIRDPEVEALALSVARQDPDLERRAAALGILDALDTPAARAVALETLATETHVGVRRAALFALPLPTGASVTEARAVVNQLGTVVSSDPDPETRRRAVIALARWNMSANDLRPVIAALSDRSVDVQAGAAFALEVAGVKDPQVISSLTEVLGDPSRDKLVRDNAWKALGRLGPLPTAASKAWSTYKKQRDAQNEAVY